MYTYSDSGGSARKCGPAMAAAGTTLMTAPRADAWPFIVGSARTQRVRVADRSGDAGGSMPPLALQPHDQRSHRLAAMRELVLALERKLGSGEPRFRVLEVRVVAESARTAGNVDDAPVPCTFGDDRLRVGSMPQEDKHAAVMRAAVRAAGECG